MDRFLLLIMVHKVVNLKHATIAHRMSWKKLGVASHQDITKPRAAENKSGFLPLVAQLMDHHSNQPELPAPPPGPCWERFEEPAPQRRGNS